MKRFLAVFAVFAMLLTAAAGLAGCGKDESSDKPVIYTSFYPIYDLTCMIAGDKMEVVNLVPAGTEPHDYEPATTEIAAMNDANLVIVNGLMLEEWLPDLADSLGDKLVYASQGVETLEIDGVEDPHIWLSPKRAKTMLANIAAALIELDPDNTGFYTENLAKYSLLLDALDREYAYVISQCDRSQIVTAHAAFGYMCADYGLTQIAIEGLSADSEPDAAKMAEIVDYVDNNGITTIFYEELISPAVAETIASETGVSTDVLNPLEGLTDEDSAAGYDYFTVMADNLLALQRALTDEE